MPHRTSIEEDNIEEERRLCYVGITRAENLNVYARAKTQALAEIEICEPTRFLGELPQDDLQWVGRGQTDPAVSKARRAESASQLAALLERGLVLLRHDMRGPLPNASIKSTLTAHNL